MDVNAAQSIRVDLNMSPKGWAMLQNQKAELLGLIDEGKASDMMNGLVHLIDSIQDQAVDVQGLPEEVVFPKQEIVSTVCKCVRCEALRKGA